MIVGRKAKLRCIIVFTKSYLETPTATDFCASFRCPWVDGHTCLQRRRRCATRGWWWWAEEPESVCRDTLPSSCIDRSSKSWCSAAEPSRTCDCNDRKTFPPFSTTLTCSVFSASLIAHLWLARSSTSYASSEKYVKCRCRRRLKRAWSVNQLTDIKKHGHHTITIK